MPWIFCFVSIFYPIITSSTIISTKPIVGVLKNTNCLPVYSSVRIGSCFTPLLSISLTLVASPVLSRYLLAAIQLLGQLLHVHPCHFRSKGVCHALEEWGRHRLYIHHANIVQRVKTCYKIKINSRESKSCFYGFLQHKSHSR